MKIQIVNIDPSDDYGSIRDKLLWSKAHRALLVWPGRGEILNSKLELLLLKRLGQQMGIAIGLVTHDPQVRDIADALSLPVFDDLESHPEANWAVWRPLSEADRRRPQGHEPAVKPVRTSTAAAKPAIHVRILAGLLPLLMLLIAIILLVPSAVVTFYPGSLRELATVNIPLSTTQDLRTPSLDFLTRTFDIQGTHRVLTTGAISVPSAHAEGSVIFINRGNIPVDIPQGTIVRSSLDSAISFRTDISAQLFAGEGEQAIVSVTAMQAGPQANLEAGSLDGVDGTLSLLVEVEQPQAMSGGAAQTRAAAASGDQQRVKNELEELLSDQALSELAESLDPSEYVLESSFRIVEVISAKYDAAVGEAADSLGLELNLKVGISYVNLASLQEVVSNIQQQTLPPGFQFTPGSPEILAIRELPHGLEAPGIEVDLAQRTYRPLSTNSGIANLRGKDPDMAIAGLHETIPGMQRITIELSPPWWPRMPLLAGRISTQTLWELSP